MLPKRLPRELVSLIHHIELHKAGWWDKAIQQLIIFMIWLNNNRPMTLSEILNSIKKELNITLDSNKAQENVNDLINNERIVSLPDGRLKLSESTFDQIGKLADEAEKMEQDVKGKFTTLVEELCPSLDASQVWSDFNDAFLIPFISEMGAYVFHLTTGSSTPNLEWLGKGYFENFVSKYPRVVKLELQKVITRFLDPKDVLVRSYILRAMNAYFYVEASGLKPEILDKLAHLCQHRLSFHIFVDTNFLFSILDLHENPSNEAAAALMKLSEQLSGVTVKFYVTPLTLEEAKRAIAKAKSSIEGIQMTSNLIAATASANFSGLIQKFFESRARDPFLDVESFFNPYIKDLLTIARSKGVELYNEKLDAYKTKQEVIDDIREQQEHERHRGSRAKRYEQLEHDMVLWHFVRDKRPYAESPLEAQYWIVTVDYRFLGFDAYKRNKTDDLPICIHPTALTHMLQFWVPRTDTLDEALFASLKLPFLFAEFDPEAERVTIAILKALSRFEKVEDLPIETITNLLLSESLRARMYSTREDKEQIELIKEALIEEHARLERMLKEKEENITKKEKTIHGLQEAIQQERRKRQSIEYQLQQARQEIKELQEKVQAKEQEERRRQEEEKQRMLKQFFIKWIVVIPIVLLAIGSISSVAVSRFLEWNPRQLMITIDGLLVLFWLWIADYRAKKTSVEHPVVQKVHEFKHWIWGVLGGGILVNALWDYLIKPLLTR